MCFFYVCVFFHQPFKLFLLLIFYSFILVLYKYYLLFLVNSFYCILVMFTFEINSLLILSISIIKSQKLNLACTAASLGQVASRLTLWTFLNKKESE